MLGNIVATKELVTFKMIWKTNGAYLCLMWIRVKEWLTVTQLAVTYGSG